MYTGGGGGGFYRKALHTRVVESRIQAFDLWVMSSLGVRKEQKTKGTSGAQKAFWSCRERLLWS